MYMYSIHVQWGTGASLIIYLAGMLELFVNKILYMIVQGIGDHPD